MAVWKGTTYKLDLARDLIGALPDSAATILGETVSPYLAPVSILSGIDPEDDWDTVAQICKWPIAHADPETDEDFQEAYSTVKHWYIGGSALYQIVNAIRKKKFRTKNQYDHTFVKESVEASGRLLAACTQIAPRVFISEWMRHADALHATGEMFEDASESFKHMRLAFDTRDTSLRPIDQFKYFGTGDRIYYGHTVRNICLMRGAAEYTDRGLIFTRSHLNFLVEALMRIANIYYFLATEYVGEETAAEAIVKMLNTTIKDASKARGANADKVVQAYHKARMYAQMLIFENCHTGALEEALLEFQEKGLNDVFSLSEFLAVIDTIPYNRRLDCLQVYKWMFPPDFDSTYAFHDLYSWHMATRPSGADPGADEQLSTNWARVVEERKRNIAATYHARCREWATWNDTIACQPNNTSHWELHKMFPYVTYGDDIVTQIKDKTTVSKSKTYELAGKSGPEETSFLLWYMNNAGLVNTEEDAEALMSGSLLEDNYAKVAYKGESHKPGSRLFFMAPPRQRILLGELEGNISDIAEFYPGSLQGKDAHQKSEMLQKLFDVYEEPPGIGAGIETETFIVTFDLSKFSPKSNSNVTKDYHEFWATVFGYDAIKALYKVGPESNIIHMQSGLNMEYKNQGADLEGFRGRMMTLFHADMLGAACRKAREDGFIAGKAVLAVFIDDGAVKVAAKGSGEEALKNANSFLRVMQDIYASAGQENHPNKTILSRVGGELLAEQYRHGYRLKCPIKAAMRLYPDYENPAVSLPEELDSLFAASQGAVKDQGRWIATYRRYIESVVKSIQRWARGVSQLLNVEVFALKLLLPKSYGGFGVQPFQGLVSTITLNLTAEGLGMLNRVGRAYPELRDLISRMVQRPVMARDPLMVLRDPTRVRADGPILIENRLMMAIVRKLSEEGNPAAAFMKGYNDMELKAHARAVGEALLAQDTVSVVILNRAWGCTPLAYVESVVGKFRRARTIMAMVGPNVVSNIRRSNSEDVKIILRRAF